MSIYESSRFDYLHFYHLLIKEHSFNWGSSHHKSLQYKRTWNLIHQSSSSLLYIWWVYKSVTDLFMNYFHPSRMYLAMLACLSLLLAPLCGGWVILSLLIIRIMRGFVADLGCSAFACSATVWLWENTSQEMPWTSLWRWQQTTWATSPSECARLENRIKIQIRSASIDQNIFSKFLLR